MDFSWWHKAATFFTEREQAAPAPTKAVTLVSADDVHAPATGTRALLALTFAINPENPIAIATGKVPGTYEQAAG